MMLASCAALAIVVLDHSALRAAPRAGATELASLWQGDVLDVRGASAGYLKVYDDRRERGGFVASDAARPIELTEAGAPELLAVLRFLADTPGSEALGISYGAAYLKAVPPHGLTAEPFDDIARMAERLADKASGGASRNLAEHLEGVQQFGIHMRSFERGGHMQVCYDGELFRRVLATSSASAEQRAQAALALTRPDCIDPDLGPQPRAALDEARGSLLERVDDRPLQPMTASRLHARRAAVYASIAFEKARRGEPSAAPAQRAVAELASARYADLGEDRKGDYVDTVLRVSAIRWAQQATMPQSSPLVLKTEPGETGQTCLMLQDLRVNAAPLVRRCTYGIVWMSSAQALPQAAGMVLAVQPLESWRELWVFHRTSQAWTIDIVSPGTEDPELGYVDFAGFAADSKRLLLAREVNLHGRWQRRFEELRLEDLIVVRQASSPDLLRDFHRWQDPLWRRDTLALH